MLRSPLLKEAAVAEGDVICRFDSQAGGGVVDPGGRAFELRIVADGGFVDDAVAFTVGPFGAPLFVAESGDESEREKDLFEHLSVGDLGFGFDAVFVSVFAGAALGKAFVRDGPLAGVVSDAQDLGAGAHLPVRGVVEDVAFKAARGVLGESSIQELPGETGHVRHFELDFSLDRHVQREYTAGRGTGAKHGAGRQATIRE